MARQCGDCQLCCRLLPVQDIGESHQATRDDGMQMFFLGGLIKPANTKCKYQKRGVGCKVHDTPAMPLSCKMWMCRWLAEDDTYDLPRPDRAGYVIDPMPDFITVTDNNTGETMNIEVIQIWLDPLNLKACEAPSFRRWLNRQRKVALIRSDEKSGYILGPPSLTGAGWVIKDAGPSEGPSHTLK